MKVIIGIVSIFIFLHSCKSNAEKADEFSLKVAKVLFNSRKTNMRVKKTEISEIVENSGKINGCKISYKNITKGISWSVSNKVPSAKMKYLDSMVLSNRTYKIQEFRCNIHAINDYWYDYFIYKNLKTNEYLLKYRIYSVEGTESKINEIGNDLTNVFENLDIIILRD